MNKMTVKLYELILELYSQSSLVKEIKKNHELEKQVVFLVSALYALEQENNELERFQLVVDSYVALFNKNLDILETSKEDLLEDNINDNINWIKVCLLNTQKYILGSKAIIINKKNDIEVACSQINKLAASSKNINFTESESSPGAEVNQKTNIDSNASSSIPNSQINGMPQIPNLTPQQIKQLNIRMKSFNCFVETPNQYIPLFKKILGILAIIITFLTIAFSCFQLANHSYIVWLVNEINALKPGSATVPKFSAGDYVIRILMQAPFAILCIMFAYFHLRTPKAIVQKYLVNGLVSGLVIAYIVYDAISYGMNLHNFVAYLNSPGISAAEPHNAILLFLFVAIILVLIIGFCLIVFITVKRPKIDKEKFSVFLNEEIQKIKNESLNE